MSKRSITELMYADPFEMRPDEVARFMIALREAREALRRHESHEPRCYEEGVVLLKKWDSNE